MGAITVTGLGKAYKQYPNRWSRLAEWMLPWHGSRHNLHWVAGFTLPGFSVVKIRFFVSGRKDVFKHAGVLRG